jgi:preprotein translocase subunit SecE
MKRTGPIQFFQQVRTEVSKVTWPTRNETMITTIIVFIFSLLASIFFFFSDQIMSIGIQFVLGLGG